jgi:hypothetical protein
VIPSYSTAPDYKIMLFPYRHGDTLPQSRWLDKEKTRLEIVWPDAREEIVFEQNDQGRTAFRILRNGKDLMTSE